MRLHTCVPGPLWGAHFWIPGAGIGAGAGADRGRGGRAPDSSVGVVPSVPLEGVTTPLTVGGVVPGVARGVATPSSSRGVMVPLRCSTLLNTFTCRRQGTASKGQEQARDCKKGGQSISCDARRLRLRVCACQALA